MPGRQAHGRPLLANPNKKRKSGKGGGSGGGGGGGGGGHGGAGGVPSGSRSSGGAPRNRQGARVDVMALAEQQVSETRAKGVRFRDLHAERDPTKRRRHDDDDSGDDEDGEGGGASSTKRRRPNRDGGDDEDGTGGGGGSDDSADELHSDSEGNEWREGVGSDDDDSEIDSDEAFGESDDEMVDAFSFRGSSSSQNKNKKQTKPAKKPQRKSAEDDFDGFDSDDEDDEDNYSDEDVGDDGADLGDDAIDLAQALDIVSSDEEEAGPAAARKEAAREKNQLKKKKLLQRKQQIDEDDSSAAEDEEVAPSKFGTYSDDDSDGGSGSDSGSEKQSADSATTDSSDFDSDDEDEEQDEDEEEEDGEAGFGGGTMELDGLASLYVAGKDGPGDDADAADAGRSAKPFRMRQIDFDRADRGRVGGKAKLDVPLLPMQQDQKLRAAAAEKAHETLDRWTETVKQNRRAEHLTFEVAGALAGSGLDTATLLPIGQGFARTELEKTILAIMEESGLGARAQADERAADRAAQKQAQEDAEAQLSPEALKALVGQKRRARELQSREQARAKRIKKIKSKAYRRVHRRERLRAEADLEGDEFDNDGADGGDGADSEEEREAQHRRRALERMGAKHRDSKWAKRAKNTNRAAWDDEFRAGLVDMARQDEELRRRVDGAGVGGAEVNDESESDSDDGSENDSDDEAFKLRTRQKLAQAGRGAAGDEDAPKGLMGIAFMQKAELARKKANDEAVAEILRDLDRGSGDSDDDMLLLDGAEDQDDADAPVGRRTYGPSAASGQANGAPSRAAGLNRRSSKQAAAAGQAEEDAQPAPKPALDFAQDTTGAALADYTSHTSAPGDAGLWTVVPKSGKKAKKDKKATAAAEAATDLTPGGNIMLDAVADDMGAQYKVAEEQAAAKAARPATTKPAKKAKLVIAVANDNDSETSSSGSDDDDSDDADDADDADHRNTHGSSRYRFGAENAQMLMQAFGEDGAAEEFAAEKARLATEEAEAWEEDAARGKKGGKSSDDFLPGWGAWIGDGMSKQAAKRDQRRLAGKDKDKGRDKDKKMAARRDAKLERVIISERRVRKNDKYLASQLPYEFETRTQYERSLRLPVGKEWSTTFAFQDSTKPRVLRKQGVVLPMAKPSV